MDHNGSSKSSFRFRYFVRQIFEDLGMFVLVLALFLVLVLFLLVLLLLILVGCDLTGTCVRARSASLVFAFE